MAINISHIIKEHINLIKMFIIFIPLQFFILTVIGLTIQLKIILYIIGLVVIFVFNYVIGQTYFNKGTLFSFVFASIIASVFASIIASTIMDFNLTILNQIMILTWSLLLLTVIEYGIYSSFSVIGQKYIDKITNNNKCDCGENEYSVVLIGNNLSWFKNNDTYVGACGLYFLIEYFKDTNKHYIICQKVDKSHFDRFVLNKNCQELYILGHGSKGSFRINKKKDENDGIIYYSEYKDAPKKRVIAQIHCANTVIGENNESLVNLLAPDSDESYIGSGSIYFINEWWYYLNLWANNMQTPPTSKLKRHLFYIIKCIQK